MKAIGRKSRKITHQGLEPGIGISQGLAEQVANSAKDDMQLLFGQQRRQHLQKLEFSVSFSLCSFFFHCDAAVVRALGLSE